MRLIRLIPELIDVGKLMLKHKLRYSDVKEAVYLLLDVRNAEHYARVYQRVNAVREKMDPSK